MASGGGEWVSVDQSLPRDGQVVLVKTLCGDAPQRATFFERPVQRWEQGNVVCQLPRYPFWRPLAGEESEDARVAATVR